MRTPACAHSIHIVFHLPFSGHRAALQSATAVRRGLSSGDMCPLSAQSSPDRWPAGTTALAFLHRGCAAGSSEPATHAANGSGARGLRQISRPGRGARGRGFAPVPLFLGCSRVLPVAGAGSLLSAVATALHFGNVLSAAGGNRWRTPISILSPNCSTTTQRSCVRRTFAR